MRDFFRPTKPDLPVPPEPGDTVLEPAAPFVPWGPWVSLALALAVVLFQQVGMVVLFIAGSLAVGGDPRNPAEGSGAVLVLALLAVTPPAAALTLLLARARGPVISYLGLRRAGGRATLFWALALVAFLAGYEALAVLLERPAVPDFMVQVYRSAGSLPLLYLAVGVLAPVFEELLFRGFLIPGLAAGWGAGAAVGMSAALWTLIHGFQYDLFDLGMVFLLGLGLGWMRVRTGSTLLPMLLHTANNLVATAQVGWYLGGAGP